jgi:hypothetical protein
MYFDDGQVPHRRTEPQTFIDNLAGTVRLDLLQALVGDELVESNFHPPGSDRVWELQHAYRVVFTSLEEEKLMRIAADQSIAEYPALAVSNFLRKYELTGLLAEDASTSLPLSPRDASEFLNKLVALGLVRERHRQNGYPFLI